MTTQFKIRISGILVELKVKESKSLILQCELGSLKRFTSKSPVNSISSFDFEDDFETNCLISVDHLSTMKLRWTLSESTVLFDNIVGTGQIDLLQISTGPIQHSIDIVHNNNGVVGNITFWVLMTQMTDIKVSLKDVNVEMMSGGGRGGLDESLKNTGFYLCFYTDDEASKNTNIERSKETTTSSSSNGQVLKWKKLPQLTIKNVTPLTLSDMNLFLKVKTSKGREITVAECEIPFTLPLSRATIKRKEKDSATANISVPIQELMTKTGLNIGKIQADIVIENIPIISQQIKNLNRDRNNPNPYSSTSAPTQLIKLPSSHSLENLASVGGVGGRSSLTSSGITINSTPQWKQSLNANGDSKSPLEKQMSEKNLFELVKSLSNNIQLFKHEKSTLDKEHYTLHKALAPQPQTNFKNGQRRVSFTVPTDEVPIVHTQTPLNNVKAYAFIRAILCLYSSNTPKNGMTIDERNVGPLIRDSFGLTQDNYVEVSKKILEYSPKQITKAELLLRYAWKDNHPIYKSEGFRDQNGHDKWRKDEINDISALLAENDPNSANTNLSTFQKDGNHPTVQEIFGATLKKHTLSNNGASKNKKDGDINDIHKGYKELVKAFVQYTLGEQYNNNNNSFLPMKETILPAKPDHIQLNIKAELNWVLKEYCTLYGIRDFYRYLVIFGILVKRFDDTVQQLNLLYNCFVKLVDIRKTNVKVITINEESKFHSKCLLLLEQLKHRVVNYRLCYRQTVDPNIRAHKQHQHSGALSFVLKLMEKIVKSLDWQDVDIPNLLMNSLIEANEKEYKIHKSKYDIILSSNSFYQTENCLEIFMLALEIGDICTWLKEDFQFFNHIFNQYLKDYKHIEIVAETFSKFIKSDLSIISQKFISVDVKKNTKMETPSWLTGILVELVPSLIEFNNVTYQYFKKKLLPMDSNHAFFSGSFVLNSVYLLERYIELIMTKQEWKPNAKGILHSSAPIDLFSYIWQCFKSIQIVEEKLEIQGNFHILLKSFGAQIEKTFYLFAKGLRNDMISDLSRDHQQFIITTIDNLSPKKASKLLVEISKNKPIIPNQDKNSTFITEKMCLQANDIEETRCLLDQFDLENNSVFGDSLLDIFKYLKYQWRSILVFFVYKMDYQLKPLIANIAFGQRENTKQDIEQLLNFLDRHFRVTYQNLYPRLFNKFLKYTFKMILLNFIDILLPKAYNKKIWTLNTIYNLELLIDNLISFFNVGNEGLSLKLIKKELRRVLSIMELFTFSIEQLKMHYRMLVESHLLVEVQQPEHSVTDVVKVMEYFKDDKSMDSFLKKRVKHLTTIIVK